MDIGILAHGRYVPDEVIGNERFVGRPLKVYVGEDDDGEPVFAPESVVLDEEKILRNTGGIKARRKAADGETTVDFIEKAFLKTGFNANDLDGIVVGTISNERKFPSVACAVQERIGAKNVSYAIDVSAACSGFLHALNSAWKEANSNLGNYLVAGVELLTRITDYDEVNADLFGDGCGVVIVGSNRNSDGRILATRFKSDVSGIGSVFYDKTGKLRMPSGKRAEGGQDVMKKATRGMVGIAHEILDATGFSKEDIALYIPHQANGRIVEEIRKKMSPEERDKVYRNIESYGNMSSASVPFAFSEALDSGRAKQGDLVMLLAAGAGLVLGGALIRV